MSVVVVDLGDGLGNGQKSVNGQKPFFFLPEAIICAKKIGFQWFPDFSGFRQRNQDNLVGSDNKPTYITAFLL